MISQQFTKTEKVNRKSICNSVFFNFHYTLLDTYFLPEKKFKNLVYIYITYISWIESSNHSFYSEKLQKKEKTNRNHLRISLKICIRKVFSPKKSKKKILKKNPKSNCLTKSTYWIPFFSRKKKFKKIQKSNCLT